MSALSSRLERMNQTQQAVPEKRKYQRKGLHVEPVKPEQARPAPQPLAEQPPRPDKLKIVLVDDQSLFRRGLSELLTHCYDFNVLGAVGSIEELRALVVENPDLLVMDLRMKPMNGLAMLEQMRMEGCMTPAIMLTMSDSEVDLAKALRIGVRGYLLKDMAPDKVVDAIRRVAAGELVIAPSLTTKMVDMLRNDPEVQEARRSLELLTERELQILRLLSRGESNKAIAQTLNISYDTVKQHVRHILNKLQLHSRVNAAIMYVNTQIGSNGNDPASRK